MMSSDLASKMNSPSPVNFFSPSYRRDLERFLLLRRSIRRFATSPIRHVVAVPAADVREFEASLSGDADVAVLAQEDYVAPMFYAPAWSKWLQRALGSRGWRIQRSRYAGRPGWIVQQIVKLSMPEIFGDQVVVVVDSDLVFTRSFGDHDFFEQGSTAVLVRSDPDSESARHRGYMQTARALLSLPNGPDDHHYMAYPAIWRGDWVRALRVEVEKAQGVPWQRALFDAQTFSEYLLYGVFVEEVLKPSDLQVRRQPFHVGLWTPDDVNRFLRDPRAFIAALDFAPLTLVVQSNLGIPVRAYSDAVSRLIDAVPGH